MSDQTEESWLTYRELGDRLGCTANAARMHAHRRGWPRRAPNRVGDPARVLVPESLDVRSCATHDAAQCYAQSNGHDRTHVQALVQAVEALREQLMKADQRADRAELHIEEERARSDKLQAALAEAVAVERTLRDNLVQEHRRFIAHLSARAPWWRRWFR